MTKNCGMLRLLICLRLGESQTINHLIPIAEHPRVEAIHIVRHRVAIGLDHPKIRWHVVSVRPLVLRLAAMFRKCCELVRSEGINAVVSFNPNPYGFIAVGAGSKMGIPYHLGYIGTDWYGRRNSMLMPRIKGVIRRASFVTTTGKDMRDGIIGLGVDAAKVAILPHAIDVAKFSPGNSDKPLFDAVFVGRLERMKRIDLILQAAALLKKKAAATLRIVGDGPERHRLEVMTRQLGLENIVNFEGYSDAVEQYLRRSRVFVMASEREGLPFAVIEAMCCGLVPVSTDVGTIRDHVTDGENGFLVGRGDVAALADRIGRLLGEPGLYKRMRDRNLEMRRQFSYEHATSVWDRWLSRL